MSALDHVLNADTLQIGPITFNLDSPLGSSSGSSPALCVTKDGPLAFTLTSDQLGLPISGLTFPFHGTPSQDQQTIEWVVDQPLDLWQSIAHLTGVYGSITTQVSDLDPTLATDCGGNTRVFQATLITTGTNNALTVSTSVGDARVTSIALQASAGEVLAPAFFNVGFSWSSWQSDGCGLQYQVPETTVSLTANILDLQITGVVSSTEFRWMVQSGPASIHGQSNQQSVLLNLNEPGLVFVSVQVTVSSDIETGVVTRHFNFAVFNEAEASLVGALCKLRQAFSPIPNVVVSGVGPGIVVGGRHLVDPLWDPPKDFVGRANPVASQPYGRLELARLNHMLQRLERQAKIASVSANRALANINSQKDDRETR
ncbi:hypothetical protein ACXU4B_10855 [Dyella soli]|uniref:Uncharacterized protein n=1 Tax=Dyella soli TaxID=522319 RepID=A0A4R0YGG6_9GAMM|nr:hypothetical protein [Dyella soli]TCI07324.1 hypothetical protein EZM97_32565 [Dyella soli]